MINAEGVSHLPMLANILAEAGKAVVVWAEQDTQDRAVLNRLRQEGHCSAILLHDPFPERSNLEGALAYGGSLAALAAAMRALADDRGYEWEAQRTDLISRCQSVETPRLEAAKAAQSLADFFAALGEVHARAVIASALGAKSVTPFELKGARQARIVARSLVEAGGVPQVFASALSRLDRWIKAGCQKGGEIRMADA